MEKRTLKIECLECEKAIWMEQQDGYPDGYDSDDHVKALNEELVSEGAEIYQCPECQAHYLYFPENDYFGRMDWNVFKIKKDMNGDATRLVGMAGEL